MQQIFRSKRSDDDEAIVRVSSWGVSDILNQQTKNKNTKSKEQEHKEQRADKDEEEEVEKVFGRKVRERR
jgi:hypothetical protein